MNQSADFDAADIEVDHINNIYDPAAQNMLHDFVEAQKHKEFEASSGIRNNFSDEQEEQSDCTSNDTSNVYEVSEGQEQSNTEDCEDVIAVQLPDPSSINAADIPLFLNQITKYMDVLKLEMDKKSSTNGASKSPLTPSIANNDNNHGTKLPVQTMTIKPNMPTQPVNIAVKKSVHIANKPRSNTGPIAVSNVRNGAVHPNEKMFYTGNIGTTPTSFSSSPPINSHWASLANAKNKNNGNGIDVSSNKNSTIQLVAPRVKKVTEFGSVDSISEEHSVGSCNVLCLSEASAFDDISVGSSSSTSTIRSSRSKNSVKSP